MIQFEIKSALGLFGLYLAIRVHTALCVELGVNSHIADWATEFSSSECLQYHSQIIDPQALMKTNSILPSLIVVPFKWTHFPPIHLEHHEPQSFQTPQVLTLMESTKVQMKAMGKRWKLKMLKLMKRRRVSSQRRGRSGKRKFGEKCFSPVPEEIKLS